MCNLPIVINSVVGPSVVVISVVGEVFVDIINVVVVVVSVVGEVFVDIINVVIVVVSVVGEVFVDIINVVVVVVLLLIKVPTRAAAIAIPRSRAASRDTITCRYEHPQQCFAKHLQQICVDCAKKKQLTIEFYLYFYFDEIRLHNRFYLTKYFSSDFIQ